MLRQSIIASLKKVARHNFLMPTIEDNYNYCPTNFVDQDGLSGLVLQNEEGILVT